MGEDRVGDWQQSLLRVRVLIGYWVGLGPFLGWAWPVFELNVVDLGLRHIGFRAWPNGCNGALPQWVFFGLVSC